MPQTGVHTWAEGILLSVSPDLLSKPTATPSLPQQKGEAGGLVIDTHIFQMMKSAEFTSTASHSLLEILIKSGVA